MSATLIVFERPLPNWPPQPVPVIRLQRHRVLDAVSVLGVSGVEHERRGRDAICACGICSADGDGAILRSVPPMAVLRDGELVMQALAGQLLKHQRRCSVRMGRHRPEGHGDRIIPLLGIRVSSVTSEHVGLGLVVINGECVLGFHPPRRCQPRSPLRLTLTPASLGVKLSVNFSSSASASWVVGKLTVWCLRWYERHWPRRRLP